MLPEDEPGEIEDDFEAFSDAAPELPADEPQEEESGAYSAFSAMEGETPATYESTPLTSGETQPE